MSFNTRKWPQVFILLCLCTLPPIVVDAGITYQPLVGIPGVDNAASNFNQYINQLYFVSISIAALLAVIKIIIGGVKWMLTDVVTQKSDAKNDIRSALLGLLLIIAAVLILGTINPQLTNLNVLQSAPGIQLQRGQGGGPGPQNGEPTPEQAREARLLNSNASVTPTTVGGLPGQQYQSPFSSESCPFGGSGTRDNPCAYGSFNVLPGGREAFDRWLALQMINPCGAGQTRIESNYIQVGRGTLNRIPTRITCVSNP